MMDSMTDRELLEMAAEHEKRCRMVAHIIGPSSAAQSALDKAEAERTQGRQAAVVEYRGKWVVVTSAEIGRSQHGR